MAAVIVTLFFILVIAILSVLVIYFCGGSKFFTSIITYIPGISLH